MKTYKTCEAMNILTEDPELIFETTDQDDKNILYIDDDYILRCESKKNKTDAHIYLNDKWNLAEGPVKFMTAIKAFSNDKEIYCLLNGKRYEYSHDISGLLECADNCNIEGEKNPYSFKAIGAEEILYGSWYIKECD